MNLIPKYMELLEQGVDLESAEFIGPVEEAWDDLKDRLGSIPPSEGVTRDTQGLLELIGVWDKLYEIEASQYEEVASEKTFTSRWNFALHIFLNADEAEDYTSHLEEKWPKWVQEFGIKRARWIYRKEALRSLRPYATWIFHRAFVVGILKHYFPKIFS